jgi:putative holliday junction resolvase
MLLRPRAQGSGSPPVGWATAERVPVRAGVRLAVDVGSVRVGVARSDPGGILASPLTVLPAGKAEQDEVAKLVDASSAIEVIVGLPTSLSGREGAAAAGARSFAAGLAERLAPIPVRLVDAAVTSASCVRRSAPVQYDETKLP